MIRAATVADAPAALECASFGDPWSEKSFRTIFADPRVVALVAELEGSLVGYSIAWSLDEEAEVGNIAVAREVRRQGIGAELLDELLSQLDARGARVTYLEVREGNAAARALYASRGFLSSGRRKGYYDKPVEDALILRRQTR